MASGSPRRKEILEKNGYKIVVINSFGEKNIVGEKFSKQLVEECAYSKAIASYKEFTMKNNIDNVILIASDTVVVNNGIIYGKPKNKNEAIEMLRSLSGKIHTVVSAVSIIVCNNGKEKYYNDSEETKVYFRKFSDIEIEQYLEKNKPYDKAGSYGVQDEGFDFVEKIDGNIDNVIGFPMKTFEKMLKSLDKKINET